jgi:hypothetical protein
LQRLISTQEISILAACTKKLCSGNNTTECTYIGVLFVEEGRQDVAQTLQRAAHSLVLGDDLHDLLLARADRCDASPATTTAKQNTALSAL